MEKSIEKILATLDGAIAGFQDSVPAIQRQIHDEMQVVIKKLVIKDGKLLNNLENLKLISALKVKIQKIILNPAYKNSVEKFIESFTDVSNLNQEYFSQFNFKIGSKKTLPVIRQMAVETTINDLMGQGMSASVLAPIQNILKENITSGGSYAAFQEQLRNHILTNETGEGSLERYTKQITTDAIHQFNAQYHDAIAQDLQFNWGRYVGSNITTSRQFCILLTDKQWVHKSQLPDIIKGKIDNEDCKLSKTTGLPVGMMPDTNPDNFKIRRGGYNCGHQFFWVPDNAVPINVKKIFNKEIDPDSKKQTTVASQILTDNKPMLDKLRKKGFNIPEDLFDMVTENITIDRVRKYTAYYNPPTKTISVGVMPDREKHKYFTDTLMPHEIGHAIHNTKKIIANGVVNKEFSDHFSKLQNVIKGKEADLQKLLLKKRQAASGNDLEQITVIADILGSLTKGDYGFGHAYRYYRTPSKPEAEIFAHGISLMKVSNDFTDITPEMKEVVDLMIEYSKGL